MINMLWPNRYREQDKIKELKYWIDCYRYKQLHVKDFEVTPEAVIMLYMRHCYDEQVKGENNDGK